MAAIDVRYARADDHWLAYAAVGGDASDVDVVWVPPFVSNLDVLLDGPWRRFVDSLAAFARVVLFDRRGTGLSDPAPAVQSSSLSAWVEDFHAVARAARIGPAALVSFDTGARMSLLVAAGRPDLVTHLILVNGHARLPADTDYPCGLPPELGEVGAALIEHHWGHGAIPRMQASRMMRDPDWVRWWSRLERGSCGRGAAAQTWRDYWDLDLRPVLHSVQAPALVLSHPGNERSRYLAEHLPLGEHIEFTDPDAYGYFGGDDYDLLMSSTQEFVTGRPPSTRTDRRLAVVLFTDIVRSTESLRRVGDVEWRRVLDDHDSLALREIDRCRGRLVKTTGDGLLATFDTPGNALDVAAALTSALAVTGIETRAGLHIGEVEVRGSDIAGVAVHIAARVMGAAAPQEILVTRTVRDLVAGSSWTFESRGPHELKGLDEEWELYAVRRS